MQNVAAQHNNRPRKKQSISLPRALIAIRSSKVPLEACCGGVGASVIKLVAVMLASYADRKFRTGQAWPRIELLAEECGLGRSTVKRALRSIEKLGWFVRHHAGYAGRRSATYVMKVGQLMAPERTASAEESASHEHSDAPAVKPLGTPEHQVICDAYSDARFDKHRCRLHVVPPPEVLQRITYFVAALAGDPQLSQPFERIAIETMNAYMREEWSDGRLEQECHPIELLKWALGPVERRVRARLTRRRRPEAETKDEEQTTFSSADTAAAAAKIAAICSGTTKAA